MNFRSQAMELQAIELQSTASIDNIAETTLSMLHHIKHKG